MTADTPPVLYISADTSGLTTRYKAEPRMHPGADAWVPRHDQDRLVTLLEEAATALQECAGHISEYENILSDYSRQWAWPQKLSQQIMSVLAAFPAPDEGEQEEGE